MILRHTKIRIPTARDPREPSALITIPVRDPADPNYWGDPQLEHDRHEPHQLLGPSSWIIAVVLVALAGCAWAIWGPV